MSINYLNDIFYSRTCGVLNRLGGLLLISTIFFSGCAKPRQYVETEIFPLTIIVTHKLGTNASDKIPEEIIDLCLIIESEICPGTAFVPDVHLVRIDLEDPTELPLKAGKSWVSGLQNFFKAQTTEMMRRNIKISLGDKEIGENFSKPDSPPDFSLKALSEYVKPMKDERMFIFQKGLNITSLVIAGKSIPVRNNLQSIRDEMANDICGEYHSGLLPSYSIIYNLRNIEIEELTKGYIPKQPRYMPVEPTADEAFRDFLKWLDGGSYMPTEIAQKLEPLELNYPHDYRFTLELVRASIYGKLWHSVAFGYLLVAADKAIRNGKAANMLRDLNRDKDNKYDGFWKLAHGHDHEWSTIIEALEHHDLDILE